ncbi:hypothetical protein [Peribacillus huizhouensis]|uniref:HEAT repeat domain-containing protein n=1 Tax=Peribacillus huizhouensis TaxID=1501239 RepID=A0ABR6CNN2_9BACI|nr:hypothetical protein [Peribacillus huizhouensis]MBA9026544.1 hypothetical protein [Peribacillus huizhouensis]
MSIIDKLSSTMNRNDEVPNIELAHELVENNNLDGIKEVIKNLSNKDKKIQNDCIKVAYEIGVCKPELISPYALNFVQLLKSRNNRLVWGGMTALSTIAEISTDMIMDHIETIFQTIKNGSVITIDKGILTLSKLAATDPICSEKIFPFLLQHLQTCLPKQIPQHAESTLLAVTAENKKDFIGVLSEREEFLTPPQLKRVKKIYHTLNRQ